jgi:hypothetical protein
MESRDFPTGCEGGLTLGQVSSLRSFRQGMKRDSQTRHEARLNLDAVFRNFILALTYSLNSFFVIDY